MAASDTQAARRRAIVTGSDSGIGRATAVAFAQAGFDVGITWHEDRDGAEETARAVSSAGGELTQLLRFMALLKASLALGAVAVVLWRFGVAASAPWLIAYLVSAAAMAAGPGLIWGMAHVGLGALLLHGGLLATLLLTWRDPAVATRLGEALATRRTALAQTHATARRTSRPSS